MTNLIIFILKLFKKNVGDYNFSFSSKKQCCRHDAARLR